MSTITSAPVWPKNQIPNMQYLPCSGYLRGIFIDTVNGSYSFCLHAEIESFYSSPKEFSKSMNAQEVVSFFETRLDSSCFPKNQFTQSLLLNWDADIVFWNKQTAPQPKHTTQFFYGVADAEWQNIDLPVNCYLAGKIDSTSTDVFKAVFERKSQVTPQTMSTYIDVIKLHLNNYNPFFYGKTFWINDAKTNLLEEFWHSPKTKTNICQNCEFRHVCIDNRLPKKREGDGMWYHTTECNYNPYIAKWKGEEGYRTLTECGVKSDETGFSIDHERIAKINEELWGED